MHSPLLLVLVVVGAIGAVGLAWPEPGGVALVVVTAIGALGLVPRWLVDHRGEAYVLAKGACVVMVLAGWVVGVLGNLAEAGPAEAALTVSLIGVGSIGLLTTGLLQAESLAAARRKLRVRRARPPLTPDPDLDDPGLEASRWLHRIDSAVVRSAGAGYLQPSDDDDSTGRLSTEELRQVEIWSERLRAAQRAASDVFTPEEMREIRTIAERLDLD